MGVTETKTQDNSAELELGWNDLKVENVRWGVTTEGQIIIHASIVNQGYEAQSGINVELRKDNPEGEIVAQQTVAELSPFTLQSIYFTLEEALGGVYYVCIAVSYTHLVKAGETIAYTGSSGDEDEPEHLVYSMFMAPRGMGESYAADPVTALAYIEQQGWLEEPLGTGMTVSYTHLDVYKRQH